MLLRMALSAQCPAILKRIAPALAAEYNMVDLQGPGSAAILASPQGFFKHSQGKILVNLLVVFFAQVLVCRFATEYLCRPIMASWELAFKRLHMYL